ncbi:DUF456 domain-containing protein [Halomicrobium sp. IBSBa]|uniref:DUF456 domain-containing protein n=1 Tax=Halomicrobium sp. IBSBa TaxID=2778916 RepID=UPI001ABF21B0|nr:DUF456 domain-containing protein [Halomicrobium sp. IBSBa]MBO4246432.1 DUF456 domain-containing protein [Halomicrobium sp. IBSBa]
MIDLLVLALAFVLLVVGVVGSVVPQMPGAPFSIAGVLVYWWHTGFSEPGTLLLAVLLAVGLATLAIDWLGGAVAAKVGGASTTTAVIASLVGVVLFFVSGGPLGMILGMTLTVFVVEYYRQQDARAGAKAALVTTLGILSSSVMQAVLTGAMLVTMVVVAL